MTDENQREHLRQLLTDAALFRAWLDGQPGMAQAGRHQIRTGG